MILVILSKRSGDGTTVYPLESYADNSNGWLYLSGTSRRKVLCTFEGDIEQNMSRPDFAIRSIVGKQLGCCKTYSMNVKLSSLAHDAC